MLPEPPKPPENNALPARHRPTLGNLAQDTTELDLWAFDDELESDGPKAAPISREPNLPQARSGNVSSQAEVPVLNAPAPVPAFERIRRNITKGQSQAARQMNTPQPASRSSSAPDEDFEDLEQWETLVPSPGAVRHETPQPAVVSENTPPEDAAPGSSTPASSAPTDRDLSTPTPPPEPVPSAAAEVSAAKVTLPRLGKLEWTLLLAFALILMAVLGWLLSVSVFSLPKETQGLSSADFPVKGKVLEVQSATTCWRTPVAGTDVVRRGTQLIPVATIQFGAGAGNVRVVFVDADGKTVGDAFTRGVKPNETHEFAATAGFDDIGMYASYRTGGLKPWHVRVFEAPSGNSQSPEFQQLLNIDIAPERREATP